MASTASIVPTYFNSRKSSSFPDARQNRLSVKTKFRQSNRISTVSRKIRAPMTTTATADSSESRSVVIGKLDADDFRHPLDKQVWKLMKPIVFFCSQLINFYFGFRTHYC